MRWPFRRRPSTDAPVPATVVEQTTPSTPAPPRRAWQVLPPLTPTVGPPTRFLPRGLPQVSGTRSLVHRPPTGTSETPAGTVTGLAETMPALELDTPAAEARPVTAGRPPVRAVPVERVAPPAPLTRATDEYVGEARQAAEPYRAPGWLRALSNAPVMDPLFGMVASTPKPAAPPTRPAPQPLRQVPVTRARRPRNRVGLGAPITADDAEPEPAPEQHTAPYALTRELAATYGADLDHVPVRRGPEVDRRAEQLQAGAYAEGGVVHLPASAGPIDSAESRALIAHELIHVAQQRHWGNVLPDESSPGGVDLEGQAQAVEAAVRSGAPLPKLNHPVPHPVPPSPEPPPVPAAAGNGPPDHRPAPDPGPPTGTSGSPSVTPPPPGTFQSPVAQPSRSTGSWRPPAPDRGQPTIGSTGAPVPLMSSRTAPETALPFATSPAARSGGVVPGRVQRRPALLAHPQPTVPAAAVHPPTTAAAPSPAPTHAPTPPAPSSPASTSSSAQSSTTAQQSSTTAQEDRGPRSWSEFGTMLGNDAASTVFDFWSIDDPRGNQSGGQPPSRPSAHAAGGVGRGGGGGRGEGSHADQQARFDEIYAIRLQAVNEAREANGQPLLDTLSVEEQQRIWESVGGDANASPGGGSDDPPITSWSGFGEALTNDYVDAVGGAFGIDSSMLRGAHDNTAASGGTAAGGAGGHAAEPHHADAGHAAAGHDERPHGESGRPLVEPDDIDLDQLAVRLYDRIRSRLRLELLLDRERAGLLSDFR